MFIKVDLFIFLSWSSWFVIFWFKKLWNIYKTIWVSRFSVLPLVQLNQNKPLYVIVACYIFAERKLIVSTMFDGLSFYFLFLSHVYLSWTAVHQYFSGKQVSQPQKAKPVMENTYEIDHYSSILYLNVHFRMINCQVGKAYWVLLRWMIIICIKVCNIKPWWCRYCVFADFSWTILKSVVFQSSSTYKDVKQK